MTGGSWPTAEIHSKSGKLMAANLPKLRSTGLRCYAAQVLSAFRAREIIVTFFSTKRLSMSSLRQSDAEEIFRVRGDAEAMKYWDWPHDKSPIVTASVVETMLGEVAAGEAHYWTLRLKANENFVGLCDLSNLGASLSAEVGFMLAREFWGLGLAQETIAALIEQARALNLTSLAARIHSDNERSARLLKSAGFQEVHAASRFEIRPGVFQSCTGFSLML